MKKMLFTLLLMGLIGCSKQQPCDVSGTVQLNGKTMQCGTVVFFAEDNTHYGGRIGKDGTYSVPGVPAGIVRVAVYSPDPVPLEIRDQKPAEADAIRKANGWIEVAPRFSDPGRSGLSYTLTSPNCTVDLVLK